MYYILPFAVVDVEKQSIKGRIRDKQVILTTCEESEMRRLDGANVIRVKNGTFETV